MEVVRRLRAPIASHVDFNRLRQRGIDTLEEVNCDILTIKSSSSMSKR
jgi:hypothetical protein